MSVTSCADVDFLLLTASTIRNKLFCWYCVTFSVDEQNSVWSKSEYSDLKNLSRSIEIKYKLFGKLNIINAIDQGQKQAILDFNNKVKEYRDIFKRLIDIVVFLCCQVAFRGHKEDSDSDNEGNFQELLVTFL